MMQQEMLKHGSSQEDNPLFQAAEKGDCLLLIHNDKNS